MTNPTSNYNFQMPTATDLVTDLPADFEVFGQAVDTRLKALQPGTTLGDLAYSSATANTNTRLPIGTTGQVLSVVGGVPTWVAATTGDITAVTAGTGISGGGTSGDVTITNSMATAITTNGDLIYGTGSGTFTRRGIGSTGDVLTVVGGVPTWSAPAAPSAMVSLASGSYTGTALNITGLSTSYNQLIMSLSAFDPSGGSVTLRARFNGDSTNKYLNTTSTTGTASNFNIGYLEQLTPAAHSTDARAAIQITMFNYATANAYKQGFAQAIVTNPTSTLDVNTNISQVYYNSTTAISQVNFFDSAGGTFSLTYQIWGLK